MGITIYRLDDYDGAIKCWENSLELNPYYKEAWRNMFITLRDLGREKEAVECLEKAFEFIDDLELD